MKYSRFNNTRHTGSTQASRNDEAEEDGDAEESIENEQEEGQQTDTGGSQTRNAEDRNRRILYSAQHQHNQAHQDNSFQQV